MNCGVVPPTEVGGVSVAIRNKQIIYVPIEREMQRISREKNPMIFKTA